MAGPAGTVIIGAGPAGLAVAACLRRANAPFVIIEQADAVGARWRSRYRRLRLHTAKQYSALPYLDFPKAYPRYPSRDQVVEYLDSYRRHFTIDPRVGERAVSLRRDDRWTVTTARGTTFNARSVVLATGRSDVPRRPRWPGDAAFAGRIVHSAEYDSGEAFAGQRVLVVGLGNSGAEIALDLAEHGATVEIALRSPVNVVPRDFLGQPIQRSTILLSRVPVAIRDGVGRAISRLVFGDLAAIGLEPAREGPVSQIVSRGRIPVIDVGTVRLIRSRAIGLRGDIASFDRDGVRFSDGTDARFDAVVLATGYDAGVKTLTRPLGIGDERGYPPTLSDPRAPGVFFVGFRTPPTGHLRQIAIDAHVVATRIAAA